MHTIHRLSRFGLAIAFLMWLKPVYCDSFDNQSADQLVPGKSISKTSTFQYNNEYSLLTTWRYAACRSVAAMGDTVLVGDGGILEVVDFRNPGAPFKLGEVVTPGIIRDIIAFDSWAYVADGVGGLLVIDVHDLTSPQIVWTWQLPGYSSNEEVLSVKIGQDGFLYFLFNGGVSRVDISNPTSPIILNTYSGVGIDIGFTVGNGYMYISGYSDIGPPQFTILDLSGGASVFQWTGPLASDMEYCAGHIYANNGYASDCAIIDVSDPPNFSGVCFHFAGFAQAHELEISNQTVFTATSSGLSIYNIADATLPVLMSSLAFNSVYDISISNGKLYAACDEEGIFAISIEDLSNPFILGRYEVPGIVRDVYADSTNVLIAAGKTLRVLQRVGSDEFLETGRLDFDLTVQCVYGIGPVAYLGTQDGLMIADLKTFSSPMIVDSLALGNVLAIDGNNSNLFVLGDALSILDASDPFHPTTLNTLLGGTYLDVTNALVAVSSSGGVSVYDVSNVGIPENIFATSLFGGSGIALSDECLVYNDAYGVYSRNLITDESYCIACGWGGPWRFGLIAGSKGRAYFENFTRAAAGFYASSSIGINDPSKDSYPDGALGVIPRIPVYSNKLHVFDDLLYNADGEAGLLIYGAPGCFFALESSADRYIDAFSQIPCDTLGGFKILCTSSKARRYNIEIVSPDLLIQLNNGIFSHSMTETTTAIAPGDSFSLSPVAVSIPAIHIRLETTVSCIVYPEQYPELSDTAVINITIDPPVATTFVTAEAALNEEGCLIQWKVSDPSQVESFDIHRSIYRNKPIQWEPIADNIDPIAKSFLDVEYPENTNLMYRIVANMRDGNIILSKSVNLSTVREKFIMYANHPNPFNPTTKIAFRLPKADHVKLAIYSVEGKLVTSLINGNMLRGYHSIEWNGLNNLGQPVSSGIYFCRLRTFNQWRVQKIALIK